MTNFTPLNQASSRLTSIQRGQLEEHTARFESATGGEKFVPSNPPDQLTQDLDRMKALFQASHKG